MDTEVKTVYLPVSLRSFGEYNKCFYRPDALPDTQPAVSKHWRQLDVDQTFVNTKFKLQEYGHCSTVPFHNIQQGVNLNQQSTVCV